MNHGLPMLRVCGAKNGGSKCKVKKLAVQEITMILYIQNIFISEADSYVAALKECVEYLRMI